ncbi:MAG: hypothetical protein Q9228_007651, partial [Teloschistes exilis]
MGSMSNTTVDMEVEVDVLIVGTGPAGASLAAFLGEYGIKGLIVGKTSSTVITPRAHITNKGAFECLRDIGLEEECRSVACPIEMSMFQRICTSMAGQEISRAYMLGNGPITHGEYIEASPCAHADLPQTKLEPILLKHATQHGFRLRFDHELLGFSKNAKSGRIESLVRCTVTGGHTLIRSKYLCGADGANSTIVRDLNLPLNDRPFQGLALNVLIEADMSFDVAESDALLLFQTHLMTHSTGLLHILTRPDRPQPSFGVIGILRFVKPWTRWVMILLAAEGVTEVTATEADILARVEELIDDASVDVKIKRISRWTINECYAERYSKDNVFCLGDAVHRHPPHNGLGSNTCVQDAYNLAWKLAYVLKGKADPSLLETYNDERQPVGEYIVRRANDTRRSHSTFYGILGTFEPQMEDRIAALAELQEDSEAGRQRRAAFQKITEEMAEDRDGLGQEMNQLYRSQAIYPDDEQDPPFIEEDSKKAALQYHQSTYPGSRLPHA